MEQTQKTDKERIEDLERKVKNLQTINYIRFGLLALGLMGVGALFVKLGKS